MVLKTVRLGGSASNVVVGKMAQGCMMMTVVRPTAVPDEQCFDSIIAGIDQLPDGAKLFLNSGEFYGPNASVANLELLRRFYTKYPEYAAKTFLSVKGGLLENKMEIDSSPENIRRSVDSINKVLAGTKQVDLFECARVDKRYPIEDTMQTLLALQKEGKFSHIGLSEVRAETVKRANAVAPISAVEIEISPWSYEEETKKVIAICLELNIPVLGYSPVGRGFLTAQLKTRDDLPEGDSRRHMPQFSEENFDANMKIVEKLSAIAAAKGVTPAQLSIGWVSSLGPHVMPLPGISSKERKLENLAGAEIELTEQEAADIAAACAGVHGTRYPAARMDMTWG